VSYSLYLLHGPIIEVLMAMQTRLANGSLVGASIFVGLALIFSLLAAWGLYSAVERPSLRLAARIAKPEKIRIDAPVPGEAMALAV
jgi:peptidoglycan/LPS O-acetylase OafA/YrhL